MSSHTNADSLEAAFTRRATMSPQRRHAAQYHPRNSPARIPYTSFAQRTAEATFYGTAPLLAHISRSGDEGGVSRHEKQFSCRPQRSHTRTGCSSALQRHQHHHHDSSAHRRTDVSPLWCRERLLASASPAPVPEASAARRVQRGSRYQAHGSHGTARVSRKQLPPPGRQATLALRSRRGEADCAVVEERLYEERFARHHRSRQPPTSVSALSSPPTKAAIPTVDITHQGEPSWWPLSSLRTTSRVQRLLCKLEAEAQRAGCPATGVADGDRSTVDLYRALFLQALADGATWESRARTLEARAHASAKREARLTQQLRHARRNVKLLAAYVEGAMRMMDALNQRTVSGTSASTPTKMTALGSTSSMPSGAPAETVATSTAVDVGSPCPGRPTPGNAVSKLIQSSLRRSLNLVCGPSGSDSRHRDDDTDAEKSSIATSDVAVQRMGGRPHAIAAQGLGGGRASPHSHAESAAFVHRVADTRRTQQFKDGEVGYLGTGVHAQYPVRRTACGSQDKGKAVREPSCCGTDELIAHTPSRPELSAEVVQASEKPHRESATLHSHTGIAAPVDTDVEGTASDPATSISSLHPSLGHAINSPTSLGTESAVHESASSNGSAAALRAETTSAVHSLLELLRSRDASRGATSTQAGCCAASAFGSVSKQPSQIAATRYSVDYEVTVAGATQSYSPREAAHPRPAMPAMTLSSFSSAASQLLGGSPEQQREANISPAASLSLLASSSPSSLCDSGPLIPLPPLLPRGVKGGGGGGTPPVHKKAGNAVPISSSELMSTLSPSPSCRPQRSSTRHIDPHDRDDCAQTHSNGDSEHLSSGWESFEALNSAHDSDMAPLPSPKREVEGGGAPAAHHTSETRSRDASGDNIMSPRKELFGSDDYAKWRAQLESHLNSRCVSDI
ncbi:hypothetical protein JKF63_03363 [Porcisia hertigi]|uniref:Uncharacterized protein n=1 Tax=Porcisia hertigi TaxID=2761500 RepID=A0A836I235_9TRYP|nr:hypothetical protein JKF63_03363 [Porcisia hertigi]